MIYVLSDLHGHYEAYIAMLDKIRLRPEDTLYVLGDVVDRGDGGIAILQDMLKRENVVPLLGNHDYTAYTILTRFSKDKNAMQDEEFAHVFRSWISDGGEPTFRAFSALPEREKKTLLFYLSAFGLYEELEVSGKRYFLSHTIPEKAVMKDFDKLTLYDFIIGEPDYDQVYDPDVCYVTGHTPTSLIEIGHRGIWQKNNHIAIDCGVASGNPLCCLRLDDMKEYYVES